MLESADNILRNQRVQPKMSSVDTITAHGQRRKVYVPASDTSDSNTPNTGKAENNGKSCSMVTTMVTTTPDRKSTRLNSSHMSESRMPSSA